MTALHAPATSAELPTETADRPLASLPGTTTIAPLVFERLAARAAAEVPGVEGEVRTGLARFLPWTSGSPADASAEVDDEEVILDLTLNVVYPQPVRQVADEVRRRVIEQVRSLTGRSVREVNITVAELVVPVRLSPRVR